MWQLSREKRAKFLLMIPSLDGIHERMTRVFAQKPRLNIAFMNSISSGLSQLECEVKLWVFFIGPVFKPVAYYEPMVLSKWSFLTTLSLNLMYLLTLGAKNIIFSFGVDHLGSCIFALSKESEAGSFMQEDRMYPDRTCQCFWRAVYIT